MEEGWEGEKKVVWLEFIMTFDGRILKKQIS